MAKIKSAPIRYKILNGNKVALCDYKGICKNKAYAEVYPSLMGGKYKKKGWNYLCKKHLKQERAKFKGKLPYCDAGWDEKNFDVLVK